MVTVTEDDAAAIQAAFHQDGELSAAIEVTRRFRAITGERAREWARMIAAWKPIEPGRWRTDKAASANKCVSTPTKLPLKTKAKGED